MPTEQESANKLLQCQSCDSSGFSNWHRCLGCAGMGMGRAVRGKWLYWSYPLTRYHLALERGRRVLNHIRWITALVFSLNAWVWSGWLLYKARAFPPLFRAFLRGPSGWLAITDLISNNAALLFWLGAAGFLYLWYRAIRQNEFKGKVEKFEYSYNKARESKGVEGEIRDWKEAKRIKRKLRINIADCFTEEAKTALGRAYRIADISRAPAVDILHLFYALLSSNRIANIFIRLGISAKSLEKGLASIIGANKPRTRAVRGEKDTNKNEAPLPKEAFYSALFEAYEEAYKAHQSYVSVTELLLVSMANSKFIQEMLFDFGLNKTKLANVVEWARIRERLYRQYVKFSHAAARRSKKGMDRAMTAVATPYLNQFSDDLTLRAQLGYLDTCVARDKEIEEVFRIVEGGEQNVILVGDHGVGKRSIVEGLAEKMVEEDVPARLKDKRLVCLSISALLGGTTPSGAVDRIRHIMHEIARAGNIILFIHNIHELVGVAAGGETGSLDVADALAEFLKSKRFLTIATTTLSDFSQHIVNSPIGDVFSKVEVREMDANQAIQVLESKVGMAEHKHSVFFSYDALEKIVEFSARFLHDSYLPGTALEVMTEVASFTRNKKGAHSLVTTDEAAAVISEKTKIPVNTVSSDESTKLLNLETEMHKRVIGQEEGVEAVANALRRARAEMRSTKRPIANFLFLGPTGVGKTELAKTIAEVYFGGEDRMARLDMSEYQDKASIYRLIGAPGEKGTGILTEAVRRAPFSLVLLDEIEKADPDVLNLFLQVMDDGRLTDASGRVIDFTNVILIATSNAGTSYIQEQMRSGLSTEAIKERLLHGGLSEYFRPEFLNRFDGIVVFKPLGQGDIKKIASLMLKRVAKDLEAKGITLKVDEAGLDFLAAAGFDPEFGARPMRRALEDRVQNKLAELLLAGKLRRRDTVVIGEEGKITVE